MLKMIRMLLPFMPALMIRDPTCPPAKEATAAGRMKRQSISVMEAYPKKPVSDEKHTIKVEEAAAMRKRLGKTTRLPV